jgi:acyl-CoA synthetase (AMP-forming)/AMP-acid ligase II
VSLAILLQMAAAGNAERVALGRAQDGVTFARLAELAAGGARVLAEEHTGHAVLLGRNGPSMPHLLFAATLAGVPFTPINYRLSGAHLLDQLARLDRPVVIADKAYGDLVRTTYPTIDTSAFAAASAEATPLPAVDVDNDSPAVVLFTSGTTSEPKMVPLRHQNLTSYVLSTVGYGDASQDDAALVTVPPYHIAGIASVLSNLYAGRRVVYLPDFSAVEWLALVRDERITSAMVVPTMLSRIVEHLSGAVADAASLRLISYGGARMPRPVLEKALHSFPQTGFVNAYGLTETSSTIALLGSDDHRIALNSNTAEIRARLSSAGKAVPGIEMQIRDDSGAPIGPNLAGELWVRGAQVSGEYLGVGSVLDADGWFPTKDQAWLDAEGYLFIEGRSDDTIIRGGENIAPAEVEDVLMTHEAVLDAAVIGVPDDEWGARLVAVIVRRDGMDVDETSIRDFVRARLRGSRTPDNVLFRDELPHTPTGKILRRQLVDDVGDLAGQHRGS